jgi:hypothetical protein
MDPRVKPAGDERRRGTNVVACPDIGDDVGRPSRNKQPSASRQPPAGAARLFVLPGDGIGPEIVGATLDVLRADRIFGVDLTFEMVAIRFDFTQGRRHQHH